MGNKNEPLKRYYPVINANGEVDMVEDDRGNFVTYERYQELKKRLKKLQYKHYEYR